MVTVAKVLHDVSRSPKVLFRFVRRDILTGTSDGQQWRIMTMTTNICFDAQKRLFDWVVVQRICRKINELAHYEKISETLQCDITETYNDLLQPNGGPLHHGECSNYPSRGHFGDQDKDW